MRHLGVRPDAQRGGEARALEILASFLAARGERYSDELSSPLTGWASCSRLSPYLAWGHVSLGLWAKSKCKGCPKHKSVK